MNQNDKIQTLLNELFEAAKEHSKNAIFNDGTKVDYAYTVGFYESAFSNMLKDMNLTEEQMDFLTIRCTIY